MKSNDKSDEKFYIQLKDFIMRHTEKDGSYVFDVLAVRNGNTVSFISPKIIQKRKSELQKLYDQGGGGGGGK